MLALRRVTCCCSAADQEERGPLVVQSISSPPEERASLEVQRVSSSSPARLGELQKNGEDVEAPDLVAAPLAETKKAEEPIFDCVVSNEKKLGLCLDRWETMFQVVSIAADGAVAAYNASAKGGRTINPQDFILEVNGETAIGEMVRALQAAETLTLRVAHPQRRRVWLPKGTLGITFKFLSGEGCLQIAEIQAGTVQAYNGSVSASDKLRRRDLIFSVNGISGSSQRLLSELEDGNQSVVVVLRPPG